MKIKYIKRGIHPVELFKGFIVLGGQIQYEMVLFLARSLEFLLATDLLGSQTPVLHSGSNKKFPVANDTPASISLFPYPSTLPSTTHYFTLPPCVRMCVSIFFFMPGKNKPTARRHSIPRYTLKMHRSPTSPPCI